MTELQSKPSSTAPLGHFPEVVPRTDGTWGVVCSACSTQAQDYVTTCQVNPARDWPPLRLIDVDELTRLRMALGRLAALSQSLYEDVTS